MSIFYLDGTITYSFFKYINIEACIADIMTNLKPTTGVSATFVANTLGDCQLSSTALIPLLAAGSGLKYTYASIPYAVSNSAVTNGYLNFFEYYNEGCTGAPVQQFSVYLGYCFKNYNQYGLVTGSTKYQLGASKFLLCT